MTVQQRVPTVQTRFTKAFGLTYPISLAGMAKVSNSELAATITNNGGLGVIGGQSKTPEQLRKDIAELKALLNDKTAPFGVDLLLPSLSSSARKTNYDYQKGKLGEIIDILCEEKPAVFVSAVGVPSPEIVSKLQEAGIKVMNMVGAVKHAKKALDAGVDMICCQGFEAGGHTGEIATSVLLPQVVDYCRSRVSKSGDDIIVLGAGGIIDGRGIAMALSLGADGVWVGTRFICAQESGASKLHQDLVINNESDATLRSTIMTGRPCRFHANSWALDWVKNHRNETERLESQGKIVYRTQVHKARDEGKHFPIAETYPQFMGQGIGLINKVMPAKEIMEEMMTDCCATLRQKYAMIVDPPSKL